MILYQAEKCRHSISEADRYLHSSQGKSYQLKRTRMIHLYEWSYLIPCQTTGPSKAAEKSLYQQKVLKSSNQRSQGVNLGPACMQNMECTPPTYQANVCWKFLAEAWILKWMVDLDGDHGAQGKGHKFPSMPFSYHKIALGMQHLPF